MWAVKCGILVLFSWAINDFLIFYCICESSQLLACDVQSALFSVTQICWLWSRAPPRFSRRTKVIRLITRRTETDLSAMMYVIPMRKLRRWERASGNLWSRSCRPGMRILSLFVAGLWIDAACMVSCKFIMFMAVFLWSARGRKWWPESPRWSDITTRGQFNKGCD